MNDEPKINDVSENEEPAYCSLCGDPITGSDVFCAGCGGPAGEGTVRRSTVIRTQIQLHPEQASRLRELAAIEGVSLAEVIRRGVDLVLDEAQANSGRDRLDALRVAGAFDSGQPGIAEQHDDELVEAYLEW